MRSLLYFMLTVVAIVVVGCVSTTKVMPTSNGTYIIQGRAVGLWNADKERSKALKNADAFCAKQGKRVLLHDIAERGHAALLGEHATITFECET